MLQKVQLFGNKDEIIHAYNINRLSEFVGNRIETVRLNCKISKIKIHGYQDQDHKYMFDITYNYDHEQKLLSVMYTNELDNCIILYYKDNEFEDDDVIDDAITQHIDDWSTEVERLYSSRYQFISMIDYHEDSKCNYLKDKTVTLDTGDNFIDENYVAKAIGHDVFKSGINDPVLSLRVL